jgi:hypothetical protein
MAGYEDLVKFTKRDNTLVRYLGYQYAYRGVLQAVSSLHLKNYWCTGEEQHRTQWSEPHMRNFLASLQSQRDFQANAKVMTRTEELVLQLTLEAILEREKVEAASMEPAFAPHSPHACTSLADLDGTEEIDETYERRGDAECGIEPATYVVVDRRVSLSSVHADESGTIKKLRAGDVIVYKYVLSSCVCGVGLSS